jgi:RNA polymerase sigma-70 factor (ECF subfamily)
VLDTQQDAKEAQEKDEEGALPLLAHLAVKAFWGLLLHKKQSVAFQEALDKSLSSPTSCRDSACSHDGEVPAHAFPPSRLLEAPQRTDECLAWKACQTGDWHMAFRILVRAYGAALRGYCGRLLEDAAQADDVYQTVLLQAFTHLPAFSGRSSFCAWLYAIARHRALDTLKASRRRKRHVAPEEEWGGAPESMDPRDTPEEELLREATYAALHAELLRLPPKTRQLLQLRYEEQLSYEEIASRCAEQPATLRVRASRALPRLRRALEIQERGP